jgi:hypothetical protein
MKKSKKQNNGKTKKLYFNDRKKEFFYLVRKPSFANRNELLAFCRKKDISYVDFPMHYLCTKKENKRKYKNHISSLKSFDSFCFQILSILRLRKGVNKAYSKRK